MSSKNKFIGFQKAIGLSLQIFAISAIAFASGKSKQAYSAKNETEKNSLTERLNELRSGMMKGLSRSEVLSRIGDLGFDDFGDVAFLKFYTWNFFATIRNGKISDMVEYSGVAFENWAYKCKSSEKSESQNKKISFAVLFSERNPVRGWKIDSQTGKLVALSKPELKKLKCQFEKEPDESDYL